MLMLRSCVVVVIILRNGPNALPLCTYRRTETNFRAHAHSWVSLMQLHNSRPMQRNPCYTYLPECFSDPPTPKPKSPVQPNMPSRRRVALKSSEPHIRRLQRAISRVPPNASWRTTPFSIKEGVVATGTAINRPFRSLDPLREVVASLLLRTLNVRSKIFEDGDEETGYVRIVFNRNLSGGFRINAVRRCVSANGRRCFRVLAACLRLVGGHDACE
jgi:hypothetical protein